LGEPEGHDEHAWVLRTAGLGLTAFCHGEGWLCVTGLTGMAFRPRTHATNHAGWIISERGWWCSSPWAQDGRGCGEGISSAASRRLKRSVIVEGDLGQGCRAPGASVGDAHGR
jgi:hypothetical protein